MKLEFSIGEKVRLKYNGRCGQVTGIVVNYCNQVEYRVDTKSGCQPWMYSNQLESVEDNQVAKELGKAMGLKPKEVIDAMRSYLGVDEPLIQVGNDLYKTANVSFNNVEGRPIFVAGDKVTIPTRKYGDRIALKEVRLNDVIADGSKNGFTSMVVTEINGNEIRLQRPYYLNGELKTETITTWKSDVTYTWLGNQ